MGTARVQLRGENWLSFSRKRHQTKPLVFLFPYFRTRRSKVQNNMRYRSGIMSSNDKTISFRAVAEKIEALDSLAAPQERPRSYLINEAITNYIELHAYQDALVRMGLEEMRIGHVVCH